MAGSNGALLCAPSKNSALTFFSKLLWFKKGFRFTPRSPKQSIATNSHGCVPQIGRYPPHFPRLSCREEKRGGSLNSSFRGASTPREGRAFGAGAGHDSSDGADGGDLGAVVSFFCWVAPPNGHNVGFPFGFPSTPRKKGPPPKTGRHRQLFGLLGFGGRLPPKTFPEMAVIFPVFFSGSPLKSLKPLSG